jgi:S1-C subfamily serine protease
MKVLRLLVVLAFAGCEVSSAVVPVGKDSYMVSSHVGGCLKCSAAVKSLKTANEFCTQQGKVVVVQNSSGATNPFGYDNGNQTIFSCVSADDPEYARPTLRQDKGVPPIPRPASVPAVSTGTGFAIHNPTTLITAFHVIEGARSIEVMCAASQQAAASIERVDPANDLALLKLSMPAPAHLALAPDNSATLGQKVFTIGFPVPGLLGTEAKYADGTISSLSGISDAANLLQVTVPSQPGNSGGPLADESGRLVGVMTSTAAVQGFFRRTGTLPQNINWAVRSEYVRPLLSGVPLQQAPAESSAVERVRQSSCMVSVSRT